MSDIADWYNRLPKITRAWLSLTLAFSLAGRLGLFRHHTMTLLYDPIFKQFQIWRLFTSILYYPITPSTGFHFLINCYFLYNYSLRLETGEFIGQTGDYLYMLLVNSFFAILIGLFINMTLLMDSLVLSVLYVWCQLNRETIVTFWFGTHFKAMYLPWVLFGFNFIIAGGGASELIGILVGHLYYFLKFTYPIESGTTSFLTTPSFITYWFRNERTARHGFGVAPTARGPPPTTGSAMRGHNWGRGRVLGGHID